tara:strand:- start:947 stop:1534 length:588 start_codon:yes stop_codon:yes gene_type:complete
MWGAIAGAGIGSVMGFMGQSSQNAMLAQQIAWNQYMGDRKREWIANRATHTGRQLRKSWNRDAVAVERERIQAQQRVRVSGSARGMGQGGVIERRANSVDQQAAEKHGVVADSFAAKHTANFKNAEAEDFAVASQQANFMMQAASQMKSPAMAAIETGISMAGTFSSIQGSLGGGSGSGGSTTINNYGLNLGGLG